MERNGMKFLRVYTTDGYTVLLNLSHIVSVLSLSDGTGTVHLTTGLAYSTDQVSTRALIKELEK